MQIYLPIAEISINVLLILGLGGGVGFLSGMFGVGGGFMMTPLLIFIGVPPAVAVASEAAQIVASSVSGVLAHWRRKNVDFKMGLVLTVGGFAGSTVGAFLFKYLRQIGQVDLVIAVSFVVLLGIVGGLMLQESLRTLFRKAQQTQRRKAHTHYWAHRLPFKMRFHRSKLYTSILPPIAIGFFIGILAAIMGVGGGFIMVPAMIYLLGMPTAVVVGTSLFQIIFVTANVTVMHSINTQTVDIVLALLLVAGGVIGAQLGVRVGARLRGEQLRALLAVIVLAVGVKVALDLILQPTDVFSIAPVVH
ncbi:MAG: sulfite exporter TauE/SafE family protein [Alphaproteobacteria bacterium]|nr:sulfite exporter TauE/SafE family protein [Alphaproteobacteria bacterium]